MFHCAALLYISYFYVTRSTLFFSFLFHNLSLFSPSLSFSLSFPFSNFVSHFLCPDFFSFIILIPPFLAFLVLIL